MSPTAIHTCSGHQAQLLHPTPEATTQHLNSANVAHSLACINRFTGHAVRPYSVAEHSLLVEQILVTELNCTNTQALMAGLYHDAHEVLCGDTSTPMKLAVGPAWDAVEHPLREAVLRHFGLFGYAETWARLIKRADLIALATERRDLLPLVTEPWPCLQGIEPVQGINLAERSFDWEDWRRAFEDRSAELAFCLEQGLAHIPRDFAPA